MLEACPADDELAAFLAGALDDAARARITAHLAGCADCRAVAGDAAPTGSTPDALLAGRYRLGETIGVGGMGRVVAALHVELERRVAIKMIDDPGSDDGAVRRFRQEAIAASRLDHPNVVRIYDFCEPGGGPPFLAMELLEGRSLATAIRTDAPLAYARAIDITIQILDGLAAAHEAGVIHRDIKPANVFLVADGGGGERVKVVDFGIARIAAASVKTTTGTVLGTPAYMAPEQWLSSTVDARADIFGVGVVLYQMLSNRLPFSSKPAERLLDTAPPPIDASVALFTIVSRALARDPTKRWPSARAMRDALAALNADDAIAPTRRAAPARPKLPKPAPRSMWRTWAIAASVTVGVGLVAIATTRFGRTGAPATPAIPSVAPIVPSADAERDAIAIEEDAAEPPSLSAPSASVAKPPSDRYQPRAAFNQGIYDGVGVASGELENASIRACFAALRLPLKTCPLMGAVWRFDFLVEVDSDGTGTATMAKSMCASDPLYREPQISVFARCMTRALGAIKYRISANKLHGGITVLYSAPR